MSCKGFLRSVGNLYFGQDGAAHTAAVRCDVLSDRSEVYISEPGTEREDFCGVKGKYKCTASRKWNVDSGRGQDRPHPRFFRSRRSFVEATYRCCSKSRKTGVLGSTQAHCGNVLGVAIVAISVSLWVDDGGLRLQCLAVSISLTPPRLRSTTRPTSPPPPLLSPSPALPSPPPQYPLTPTENLGKATLKVTSDKEVKRRRFAPAQPWRLGSRSGSSSRPVRLARSSLRWTQRQVRSAAVPARGWFKVWVGRCAVL